MTKITLDEWEQAVVEAMGQRIDDVPKEWITIQQFAQRIKRKFSTASKSMRLLEEAGKAETKTFRIMAGSRVLPVRHYRLKKK